MKIAHIAPPWLPVPPRNYGGTEAVIYNLVEEQVAQGHDVTLLAPGDAKTSGHLVSFFPVSLSEEGVPWGAHMKPFYHMYKSIEYVQTHDFDIVHLHLSSAADMYMFPLSSHLQTPHVATLHSRFPFDRVQSWIGSADELYMHDWASDMPMVAISESSLVEVPYPLNFVGIVHHGVPMQQFTLPAKKRGDFFVWLGRFVEDKAPHLAIEAAKRAGVKLTLAGTIDRNVQASVNYFQNVIKPQVDGEQIRYVGPVNMKEKISLLSRACGFLNPIQWEEPFGMVMIEAMALGCPVISFARGAAPEIIVHRKTGFLVRDVDEMVQFIPRVAELDRAAIRQYVENHFSARVMAEKYMKVYQKVIATANGPSVHAFPAPVTAAKAVTNATVAAKSTATARVFKRALPAEVTPFAYAPIVKVE